MRYFLIGLLALLSLEASSTNSVNPAHIRGVVKDFKGGDVIMMINRKKEVVQVDDNGVFDYTTTLKEPGKAILFFEKYEYILPLYIENGMEASLTFSFVEKKDKSSLLPYDLELEYSGDNGDCTELCRSMKLCRSIMCGLFRVSIRCLLPNTGKNSWKTWTESSRN